MAQEEFDVEAEETTPEQDMAPEEVDVDAEITDEGGAGALGSISVSDEDIEGLADKNVGDSVEIQMVGTVGEGADGKKVINFDSGFITEGEGEVPGDEELDTGGDAIAQALGGGGNTEQEV